MKYRIVEKIIAEHKSQYQPQVKHNIFCSWIDIETPYYFNSLEFSDAEIVIDNYKSRCERFEKYKTKYVYHKVK